MVMAAGEIGIMFATRRAEGHRAAQQAGEDQARAYRERLREAFYGDLDPAVVDAAIALLTPDVPAGIGLGTTTLTAGGWGSVPRTYVVCTQDMTIRPALQRRFITDADAVFPANSTTVHTLHAAHSPFLSMPGELADIVAKVGR